MERVKDTNALQFCNLTTQLNNVQFKRDDDQRSQMARDKYLTDLFVLKYVFLICFSVTQTVHHHGDKFREHEWIYFLTPRAVGRCRVGGLVTPLHRYRHAWWQLKMKQHMKTFLTGLRPAEWHEDLEKNVNDYSVNSWSRLALLHYIKKIIIAF